MPLRLHVYLMRLVISRFVIRRVIIIIIIIIIKQENNEWRIVKD